MDLILGLTEGSDNFQDITFNYLIKLMGCRNQLRMNHWQTKSYAEHKLTDDIIGTVTGFIDTIGETALGLYGRPKINTVSTNISDIGIASTSFVLKTLNEITTELLNVYKEANESEGMIAILGELDADIKKFMFLDTLN